MSKFILILLTITNSLINNLHASKINNDFTLANFHLKWVYDGYLLPLQLEKKIQPTTTNTDFKWFKYSEKVFLDDISDQSEEYFVSKTHEFTRLSILEYNFTTHEQLSSYEPKLIDDLMHDYKPISQDYAYDFGSENLTDIFTLAYMKSHDLVLNRMGDKTEVSCLVKVMLPINDEFINEKNYNLLQKYLYIRIAFKETNRKRMSRKYPDRGRKTSPKRFKRKTSPKRVIPSTFIEVELKEGPFIVSTQDFKSNNVTCTLGLIDYDDTIPFEETVFELINDLKDEHASNKHASKEDMKNEESKEDATHESVTDSYNLIFNRSDDMHLNFSLSNHSHRPLEYFLILFSIYYMI